MPKQRCTFGVTEQTYFRWRTSRGGLKVDTATMRCRPLGTNTRLTVHP